MSRKDKVSETTTINFGKHKGKAFRDVPASYLVWFMSQDWAEEFKVAYQYCMENERQLIREAGSMDD